MPMSSFSFASSFTFSSLDFYFSIYLFSLSSLPFPLTPGASCKQALPLAWGSHFPRKDLPGCRTGARGQGAPEVAQCSVDQAPGRSKAQGPAAGGLLRSHQGLPCDRKASSLVTREVYGSTGRRQGRV